MRGALGIRAFPALAGGAVAAAALFAAAPAAAFCRTTTCDITDVSEDCRVNEKGCATAGFPLYWRERCLSFAVQKDGSPRLGIGYEVFDSAVQKAFSQWLNAPCPGGKPSFTIEDFGVRFGPVECTEAEYNKQAANANIWMFRDDAWPYPGPQVTLALTTVSFEIRTGRILDADVEMNSRFIDITTSETNPGADLQSIATHEAGHFLGLAHSDDRDATMYAAYDTGDLEFRQLKSDDIAGICTVYPPGRSTPECTSPVPIRGFSKVCGGDNPVIPDPNQPDEGGCSVTAASPRSPVAFWLATAAALSALLLRRRAAR